MPELHCETCRQDMLLEMPPCVDGHGADCPELVCTGCGSALIGVLLAELSQPAPGTTRTPAPRQPAVQRILVTTGCG